MRMIYSVLAICFLGGVCQGAIQVDWESSSFLADPATNYIADATYAQLLWSSDNVAYSPSSGVVSASDAVGTLYGSNDYLLDTVIVPAGEFGQFGQVGNLIGVQNGIYSNSHVGGNNIDVGYIYSILFANTNLGLGTWAYISPLSNAAPYSFVPPAPPPLSFNPTINPTLPPFTTILDFQLVPEPSSFFLFSLGAVSLAAFRRRRK